MASWLDKTGLTYFWSKCKAAFAAKSHTHSTQNLSRPTGLRGINDVTLQSLVNSVRANRLAFLPADQIIIEKTVDGGVTWTDAGVSDAVKTQLFSETRPAIYLPMIDGKKNILCGLRITFTAMKYNVPAGTAETQKYQYWSSSHVASANRYCQLKELYFWINSGPATMGVKLERATGANSNNWVTIFDGSNFYMNGYSGCDYISFSQGVFGGATTQTGNYWNYRLTFMTKGTNGGTTMPTSAATSAQQILEIRGYGDTWWTKDSEYMANDKLYTHDYQQNVTFPAKVTATEFSGSLAASDLPSGITWKGSCSTAEGTAAKVVTLDNNVTGFTLKTGAVVIVACSKGNTVSTEITFNVAGTGAKVAWLHSSATSASNSLIWDSGCIISMIYDGNYWRVFSISDAILANAIRRTSANLPKTGSRMVRHILATSTMTEGKPMMDGHILDMDWDNSGGYRAQFFLPTVTSGSGYTFSPQWRTQNGGTYSAWDTFYTEAHKPTPADIGAAASSHTHSAYANQNAFSNVKVGSTTVSADTTTDTLELVAGSNVTLTPDATNDKVTIAASGEANQNAFSNVKVGSTTVAADTTTDTLELVAGSNVTLTPDATNDKVTIAATDTTALGSMTGTLGVGHGGTGVATLGAGVVYHSASGTGALSIATAANLVSALGTTAVNRATADASGNNIANTYYKKSELGSMFYGTCSTAAATQAKVVACSTFTAANLVAGCSIDIKFTNAQTYNGAPTLNINSTGAKTVKMIGTTNPPQYWWQAGEMVTFVYDGTNWLTTKGGYATTTYYGPTKLSDAINSTSTTLAATANAAKKAYNHAAEVIAPETGTVTLVYTGNGSQLEPGTGVWKSGHVVTVYLQYSSTVAMTWNGNPNNNDVVASIPTSFAPAGAMRFPMFTTSDWGTFNIGYMTIQSDGKLVALSKSTTCMFGVFTFVKTN